MAKEKLQITVSAIDTSSGDGSTINYTCSIVSDSGKTDTITITLAASLKDQQAKKAIDNYIKVYWDKTYTVGIQPGETWNLSL